MPSAPVPYAALASQPVAEDKVVGDINGDAAGGGRLE